MADNSIVDFPETNDSTCFACGASIQYRESFSISKSDLVLDHGSTIKNPHSASCYHHAIHLHERLAQLLLLEPPIVHDHKMRLAENAKNHPFVNDGSVGAIKKWSRSLIQKSGLSCRKYLEKYLTIFNTFSGHKLPPRPDEKVVENVRNSLHACVRGWLRLKNDRGWVKKPILSINLLMLVSLLNEGQKYFDVHKYELPLTDKDYERNLANFMDMNVFPLFPCPVTSLNPSG